MNRDYCPQCGHLKRRGEDCPVCRGDDDLYCPECKMDVRAEYASCSYCGARLYADANEREEKKESDRERGERDNELVCVKETTTRQEAVMVRSMLESYGIWSMVKADDVGGMRPDMLLGMPARIYVRLADEREALELLLHPQS